MPGKKRAKKTGARRPKSAVDLFSESIKATFDLNFFVVPLMAIVLGIAAMLGIAIVMIPFVAIGIGFAAASNIAPMAAIAIIGIFIFIALTIVASAIIGGFYYKSVDQYLKEKKVSIEENIKFALGKWQKLVAVSILEMLVSIAILILVMVPAMAFTVGSTVLSADAITAAVSTGSETAIMASLLPALVVLGIAFAVLMAIMFFINPLLFLWFPTAVFEKKSALECVGKGYAMGKAKYLRNLAALLLMGIIGCFVVGAQMADPIMIIGIILGIWLELAATIMIVKIYMEGA